MKIMNPVNFQSRDYRELRAALMQETAQIISQLETDAKTDVETEIEKYKRQKQG